MKFKVGDKVRIVKNIYPNECIGNDKGIGEVCTIVSCNGSFRYPYCLDAHEELSWCDEELELVPQNKIVITTDGKTTKATLYHDNMKTVATARCAPEDEFDFNVGAELAMKRLMEAVKSVTVNGFKVGDRVTYYGYSGTVICISNIDQLGVQFDTKNKYAMHSCGGFNLKAGKTGKIGMCKWAEPDDLKHIEPNEAEPPKYYSGKVVCVKNTIGNEVAYTVGKIYTFVDGNFVDELGNNVKFYGYDGHGFISFNEWCKCSCSQWLEIKE